jgi:hypothetical protein
VGRRQVRERALDLRRFAQALLHLRLEYISDALSSARSLGDEVPGRDRVVADDVDRRDHANQGSVAVGDDDLASTNTTPDSAARAVESGSARSASVRVRMPTRFSSPSTTRIAAARSSTKRVRTSAIGRSGSTMIVGWRASDARVSSSRVTSSSSNLCATAIARSFPRFQGLVTGRRQFVV